MKLTALFLLAAVLQVSARGTAQTITYSAKSEPLTTVFAEIKRQTGYALLFRNEDLKNTSPVTVSFNNVDIKEALQILLQNQPLTFLIEENTIFIRPKVADLSPRLNISPSPAIPPITGIVRGPDGQPLASVNVVVRGTRRGVVTDLNGRFSIQAEQGQVLVVSIIGYGTKEIKISNEQTIVIALEQSTSPLDEVQIVAYGETSKRFQTGNVSSVRAVDIAKQPVNNPLLALQGRVPGLIITQASGFSGSGVQVLIQGQNSLIRGNDPFYVIDGIPYTSQLLPNLGSVLGASRSAGLSPAQYGNPLSFLNPADINSIEVLKDADATAIYGSRAANGAILITTKKGKVGPTKVDINIQSGVAKVAKTMKLLNTQQYLEIRKEAYANEGISPIPSTAYDLVFWDQDKYTDWQRFLIGNRANYHDAQLSISGGQGKTQYLLSSGYHKESTVFPTDLSDQKTSFHLSLNTASTNDKFKAGFSASYLADNNRLISTDITPYAMSLAPNTPDLRNDDGSINWAPDSSGTSTLGFDNPLAILQNKYMAQTNNLIANADLAYEIIPGLMLKSTLGYNNLQTNEISTNPMASVPPEQRAFFTRRANYGDNQIGLWNIEPQITYTRNIGDGKLSVLIGSTFQERTSSRQLVEGRGYNSDLVLENINAAASVVIPENSTIISVYKYNAFFGRVNYNLKDKYIINLNARRDGSSRFGAENRFHNFGAVGAAWIFSSEPFISDHLPVLSFGKLKGSYGTTGSDQIGDYEYMSLYANNNPPVPYRNGTSLMPQTLANPFIQWEETKKLSIGLDLGFFKDRILINTNYFQNRGSNQLLSTSLPSTTGPGNIATNLSATIQNTGWEIQLNAVNIKTKYFNWETNFNFTIPKNKLLSFKNLESSQFYANDYIVGEPVSMIRLYDFAGVNAETGLYEFYDTEGKLTSNPGWELDNKTKIINTDKRLYGGFSNRFTYKAFSLDILFQFAKHVGQSDLFGTYPGFAIYNQPVSVLDRWQKPGNIAPIQRYTTSNFDRLTPMLFAAASDGNWEDASYVRLKNLSFSWQLPAEWMQNAHLKQARLYIQGQNLLTITNYSGIDPETRASGTSMALPPLRVITGGIQVTF